MSRDIVAAARACLDRADFDSAVRHLSVVAGDGADPEVVYLRGVCLGGQGRFDEAMSLLTEAQTLGFDAFWCAFFRGQFALRLGDRLRARAELLTALVLDSRSADLRSLIRQEFPDVSAGLTSNAGAAAGPEHHWADPAGVGAHLWALAAERRRWLTEADIDPSFRALRAGILEHLHAVYGRDRDTGFNKSVHADGFNLFVRVTGVLASDPRLVHYLEIGSFEGTSMAVVGGLLSARQRLGSLTSIDPYFESGYQEVHPAAGRYLKASTKATREKARRLYERMQLRVRLVEDVSERGLRKLISEGQSFDLVYIDGRHDGLAPTIDFGLSMALLRPGGAILLDDWFWPDIVGLKALCDRHLAKIDESPEIAAYVKPSS